MSESDDRRDFSFGDSASTGLLVAESSNTIMGSTTERRGVIASGGPSVDPEEERIDPRGFTPATVGGRGVARFQGADDDAVRWRAIDGGVSFGFSDVARTRVLEPVEGV
jgi:hypothetical protein